MEPKTSDVPVRSTNVLTVIDSWQDRTIQQSGARLRRQEASDGPLRAATRNATTHRRLGPAASRAGRALARESYAAPRGVGAAHRRRAAARRDDPGGGVRRGDLRLRQL